MTNFQKKFEKERRDNFELMDKYLNLKKTHSKVKERIKKELYEQLVLSHNPFEPELKQLLSDQKEEIKHLKREISRLKTGIESSSDIEEVD